MIFTGEKSFLVGKSWHETVFYTLFQSVTTRSGGLATMDIRELSQPTLLFMSILMFIGASQVRLGAEYVQQHLLLVYCHYTPSQGAVEQLESSNVSYMKRMC